MLYLLLGLFVPIFHVANFYLSVHRSGTSIYLHAQLPSGVHMLLLVALLDEYSKGSFPVGSCSLLHLQNYQSILECDLKVTSLECHFNNFVCHLQVFAGCSLHFIRAKTQVWSAIAGNSRKASHNTSQAWEFLFRHLVRQFSVLIDLNWLDCLAALPCGNVH